MADFYVFMRSLRIQGCIIWKNIRNAQSIVVIVIFDKYRDTFVAHRIYEKRLLRRERCMTRTASNFLGSAETTRIQLPFNSQHPPTQSRCNRAVRDAWSARFLRCLPVDCPQSTLMTSVRSMIHYEQLVYTTPDTYDRACA